MVAHRSFILLAMFLTANIALANSYSIEAITLPDSEDVTHFTNGLVVPTGARENLDKEDILEFLKDGVYVRKDLSPEDHVLLAQRTKLADGLFTDKKGIFYWWTLVSPNLLWLQTNENGSAILELRKQ